MTAKILQFPRRSERIKQETLNALNQIRQLENADKNDLDTVIDLHMTALAQDLYHLGIRWTETPRTRFTYELLCEMVRACIYKNEGYEHPFENLLEELVPQEDKSDD